MSKHTPGPWEFVQAGSGNFPTWNVRLGDRGLITLPATASMETMDADARLIAAAPMMYEALKRVVGFWDTLAFDGSAINNLHAEARAAIAKAEGA